MIPGNANPLLLASAAAADDAGYQIQKSVRFNDGDFARLDRTPSTAGNRKKWTWSAWVKRSTLGTKHHLFAVDGSDNATYFRLAFNSDNTIFMGLYSKSILTSSAKFVDVSAWYHIVAVLDNENSTADDKAILYVNGVRQTVTLDVDTGNNYAINSTRKHNIGSQDNTSQQFDGYMADIHFCDGLALAASDFGKYDDNNVWRPKEFTGTFGTNGYHLFDFANESSVGHDSSGNENDYTPRNISTGSGPANDVLFDTPTNGASSDDSGAGGEVSGNYPTWNPLDNGGSLSLNNGNLQAGNTGSAHNACRATIKYPSTGKWYYEAYIDTLGGACCIGVDNSGRANPSLGNSGVFLILVNSGGNVQKYNGGNYTNMSGMGTPAQGGILQVAYDADADKLWLGLNNNWMGSGSSANGNPGAGTEASISSVSDPIPVTNLFTSNIETNFGQRSFNYSAPTDFKPLCTALFPTPTIADGSDYFEAKTYTGNGSTQSITGLEFSPDWVWIKNRGSVENHSLSDIVRGANKQLESSRNIAETTHSNQLTSFDSSGFSLGSSSQVNENNVGHVAWCWDAGSSTVSNTDGNVTTNVRANTSAGFSIVTYTGSGSSTASYGHGLGVEPHLIITKKRNAANDWYLYFKVLGNGKYLSLNSTNAAGTLSNYWGTVNNTVFSQTYTTAGPNNGSQVAYCFAPVAGYSAVGSYEGNGSSSAGPFILADFRVNFLLVKNIDTAAPWFIFDAVRDPENTNGKILRANDTTAEFDGGTEYIDFLSNGFKLRTDNDVFNKNGDTYAYWAIAENPFQANGGLAR